MGWRGQGKLVEGIYGKIDFPSKKLLSLRNAYAVFWRGNKFLVEGVEGNAEIPGGGGGEW